MLAVGPHTIVAERNGQPPQTRKVTLAAGKKETVAIFWATGGAPPKKPCGKFLKRCD
jgi:hypothetical protein